MDIYLSVNNRAEVIRLPVLPAEFTISKPQNTETFETVDGLYFVIESTNHTLSNGWHFNKLELKKI